MNTDTLEWLLERAIESYEAEDKSTDKIRERINFILSLAITPCFAIVAYLISSLRGELFLIWNIYLFWLPLSIAILILLVSTGYVAYVLLWPFKYSRLPSPSKIIEYVNAHPEPDTVLLDARNGLLNEIANSVDHNFTQNQHRKSKLLTAQRLAFCTFSLLILVCVPRWGYVFTNVEPEAQSVKIVSPIQVIQEPKMTQPTQKQPAAPQQPAPSTTQNQQQTTSQTNVQQAKPNFPRSVMTFDSVSSVSKPEFPKSSLALESFDPKNSNNKSGK